jgi:hypothetical protein
MAQQWSLMEFRNLYQARHLLSRENRMKLGLLMPVDVYVQEPHMAKATETLALNKIWVGCEPDLMAGPTSARIAVVDYDAGTNTLREPAQWDRRNRRFFVRRGAEKVPITRSHSDLPQFHQVNVWAIIQSVMEMYEASWVLGRSAPWAFDGIRLLVVPHAGYQANAFYDRRSKSIQFYYFGPPEERLYTCLSHDIIAHEAGRAILDGLRPGYYEDSSLQTTAFHECVGDLTAIMISLLNNQLRWELGKVSGNLCRDTTIAALAEEFGHYATGRPHLRSALNTLTMGDVHENATPDDWAPVMTGAMWDILGGVFARYRTKPKHTGRLPSTKEALLRAVSRFCRIVFQPLDYLPPVDVQFSDYARAVLQADKVVDPVDEDGLRGLMKEVFCRRGIEFEGDEDQPDRLQLYALDIDRISRSRADAYHFLNANRHQLCIPLEQDISVIDLYQTAKTQLGRGKLSQETVLQYAWREDVELRGAEYGTLEGEVISLLCGGTLILGDRGNVVSWLRKPGSKEQEGNGHPGQRFREQDREIGMERRKHLLHYLVRRVEEGQIGLLEHDRSYEIDVMAPVVAIRGAEGTLRLEVTPHLRRRTAD